MKVRKFSVSGSESRRMVTILLRITESKKPANKWLALCVVEMPGIEPGSTAAFMTLLRV